MDEPTWPEMRREDPFESDFDTAAMGFARVVGWGRYSFSRYPVGAWEFSDGSLGATGKSPIRAFFHWRRWRREYRSKPPGYWAE